MKHDSRTFKHIADRHTILRAISGSELYGIATGSGDRDEMGVLIEPPEYVLGLKQFEQYQHRTQPQGVRSGPGDLDLTVYGLRKWTRLAADGNPTVLLLGFAPDSAILMEDETGKLLRNSMELFHSRQAAARFIGYCVSQLSQLRGEKARKHTNRPELIQEYGYDTKFAAHAVRLAVQGIEYLETGGITLPMPEPWRSYLIGMRTGKVEYFEAVTVIEEQLEKLREIERSGNLRPSPAYREIDLFLQEAYMHHWSKHGLLGGANAG